MVRRELGREPDLPAGPKFFQVPRNDIGFQRTIDEAQETLDEFRRLIEEFRETDVMPMIKVAIYEDDNRAFMWICNLKETAEGFSGELFEVPSHFKSYAVGDRVSAAEREILDWMVNKHGILYGGFSLRYQRAEMTPEEQQEFDDYIGVSDYVPLEHGDR